LTTLTRSAYVMTTTAVEFQRLKPHPTKPRFSHGEVLALFDLALNDLLFKAHSVHREHFDPNAVQLSTLLSIKTGGCPEDCGYCPQAARYHTGVDNQAMLPLEDVVATAKAAKQNGAQRFCMGAAWRGPKQRDLEPVIEMIKAVRALGLETCATLGMLRDGQAQQLKDAGLDYYNHNLDTSPEFYGEIVSTREYDDRLDTLNKVRDAGLHVCCGGIVGMGESRATRAEFIAQLANLDPQPESLEYVRTIAVARITMPKSYVRISAGRHELDDGIQAMCFFAGANSIFYGENKLLTTSNPEAEADRALFAKLGLHPA
jgi:biotin synthase